MALLLHCRLIVMIPLPPAASNYYKVIHTSWGGVVQAWRTYQYLWWWCPDLQEHGHIRGVSQLRKWPLSEIKVTFWWQKWSVGQYRFPQTVYPIYVASKWGKLVYTKHKNDQRCPKVVSKRLILKQICSASSRLYWGLLFFTQLLKVPSFFITDNLVLSSRKTIKIESEVYVLVCLKHPCLA